MTPGALAAIPRRDQPPPQAIAGVNAGAGSDPFAAFTPRKNEAHVVNRDAAFAVMLALKTFQPLARALIRRPSTNVHTSADAIVSLVQSVREGYRRLLHTAGGQDWPVYVKRQVTATVAELVADSWVQGDPQGDISKLIPAFAQALAVSATDSSLLHPQDGYELSDDVGGRLTWATSVSKVHAAYTAMRERCGSHTSIAKSSLVDLTRILSTDIKLAAHQLQPLPATQAHPVSLLQSITRHYCDLMASAFAAQPGDKPIENAQTDALVQYMEGRDVLTALSGLDAWRAMEQDGFPSLTQAYSAIAAQPPKLPEPTASNPYGDVEIGITVGEAVQRTPSESSPFSLFK